MSPTIQLRGDVAEAILRHARSEPRIECCGLLAGAGGVITAIFPATNALASPTTYEIAPQELFTLFRAMRSRSLEHLGIYHSHPTGDNAPSPSDIEQACYPETAYFIISPRLDAPRPLRAFSIADGGVQELEVNIQ